MIIYIEHCPAENENDPRAEMNDDWLGEIQNTTRKINLTLWRRSGARPSRWPHGCSFPTASPAVKATGPQASTRPHAYWLATTTASTVVYCTASCRRWVSQTSSSARTAPGLARYG